MAKVNKGEKASYVDGYVLVVPKAKLAAYKKMAKVAEEVWMKHGALDYKECVGDDMNVKWGLPFPKLAGAKNDDLVIFAFVTYKNKSERNKINKKVMSDPKLNECGDEKDMPFDMKKMAYGGFKVLVG